MRTSTLGVVRLSTYSKDMLSTYVSARMKQKDRFALFLSTRWLLVFTIGYGLFVAIPFLAPIFMRLGWELPGRTIYTLYSFLCHQLPERSFFLFGSEGMYSLADIQSVWQNTINPMVLRQFIGNPAMGWKVAWSDRMVSMYTSIWLFGTIWWLFPQLRRKLSILGLMLLSLPMVIDGGSHMISDIAGIGQGFRYTNLWLAELTQFGLPESFYVGDALGSFNSWMRLITGTLFGFGIVWYIFPYLQKAAEQTEELILIKYQAREELFRQLLKNSLKERTGKAADSP